MIKKYFKAVKGGAKVAKQYAALAQSKGIEKKRKKYVAKRNEADKRTGLTSQGRRLMTPATYLFSKENDTRVRLQRALNRRFKV